MRLRLACTALFVAASAGCSASPVSEPSQQAASPIAGGTLDADDAAVFQVFTRFEDSVASCTASLIAPNVLLTARHCISVGKTENVICGRSPFSAPVAGRDTVATNATQPANDSPFYHGADVRVPSDGRTLLSGMYASARIVEATSNDAVLVPKDAVATRNGKRVVQKVQGDTVVYVEVVEGLSDAGRVQIVKGLASGDSVLADGRKQLAPGAKIRGVAEAR